MLESNFQDPSLISGKTIPLNHHHIVAAICKKINLIQEIDRFFPNTHRKVSVGKITQALIINGLGLIHSPLYLMSEFYKDKDIGGLIGRHILPEDLNDDSIARALDALFDVGVTEVFSQISSHALKVFNVVFEYVHLDSTTFSVYGDSYNSYLDKDPRAINVVEGYSKAHRPDLKQAVVSMITTYRSIIPIWLEVLHGNSIDKVSFPRTVENYIANLHQSDPPYFVVDSALYTAENLQKLSAYKWVTRVPEVVKEVREIYRNFDKKNMTSSSQFPGYHYSELCSIYAGVKQRWLLVFSQQAFKREVKTLQKKINKDYECACSQAEKISKKEFEDYRSALIEIKAVNEKLTYHSVNFEVEEVIRNKRRGRPRLSGNETVSKVRLATGVVKNESRISSERELKGKFIIATNEIHEERLDCQSMLELYKGQGVSVERGFRFLKDPLFFTSNLFVKRPERMMALLMVMGAALLVYSLAERYLKERLKVLQEVIPDHTRTSSKHPTMRRVFQLLDGIYHVTTNIGNYSISYTTGLDERKRTILRILGPEFEALYDRPTTVMQAFHSEGENS